MKHWIGHHSRWLGWVMMATLFTGCLQSEGQPCQVDEDCADGRVCSLTGAVREGVCADTRDVADRDSSGDSSGDDADASADEDDTGATDSSGADSAEETDTPTDDGTAGTPTTEDGDAGVADQDAGLDAEMDAGMDD